MSQKYCPECGDPLNPGSNLCTCGWRDKRAVSNFNPRHGFCAYSNCPLPGAISESTRNTSDTPFYCRFHINTHGDPKVADQLLQQILRNEIGIKKTDWRDELMEQLLGRRHAA